MQDQSLNEQYQTKADAAFARILSAIMYGELKPGDRILTAEWAQRVGVSDIPIREALRRLDAQGLVRMDPHRGASVTKRSRAHVEETYLIRMALETLATRRAMERCSPSELSELIEKVAVLVSEMDAQLQAQNLRRVHQVNLNIHLAIYQMAQLPRVVELIQSMWVAYAFNIISMNEAIPYVIGQHHHQLLDALKSGDREAVVAIVRDDLEEVHRAVMTTLSFEGDSVGRRNAQPTSSSP